MADIPLRLVVLKRLTTLLEQINALDQNGVAYNLTGNVYRGRTEFGTETMLPALSILEAPAPALGNFAGENGGEAMRDTWLLLIQGWATDDKLNPSDPAYYLAAATVQQLAKITATRSDGSGRPADPVNHLLGGIIDKLEVGPYVVRPLDNTSSSRAFFYLPIRMGIAQLLSEPYLSA